MKILASDLIFPEGPVAMPDRSVLLVEMGRGTLSRVSPQGKTSVVATLGGGPNGAAIGPGGKIYVCNNGGSEFARDDSGGWRPVLPASSYTGGRIEVVDPQTGRFERLYDRCDGQALNGPNDLVFDAYGGFWFTDFCKRPRDHTDRGGIYWARADGSEIRRAVSPVLGPNGIGLSPDGTTLYVAETQTARVYAWDVTGPGTLRKLDWPATYGARFVAGSANHQMFDSLKISASGKVCVATLFNGGITEVAPDGGWTRHHPLPDLMVTNLCFGGPDLCTAYITLGHRGLLVAMRWHEPGLRLAYQA